MKILENNYKPEKYIRKCEWCNSKLEFLESEISTKLIGHDFFNGEMRSIEEKYFICTCCHHKNQFIEI